jgi:hypothetical protein
MAATTTAPAVPVPATRQPETVPCEHRGCRRTLLPYEARLSRKVMHRAFCSHCRRRIADASWELLLRRHGREPLG